MKLWTPSLDAALLGALVFLAIILSLLTVGGYPEEAVLRGDHVRIPGGIDEKLAAEPGGSGEKSSALDTSAEGEASGGVANTPEDDGERSVVPNVDPKQDTLVLLVGNLSQAITETSENVSHQLLIFEIFVTIFAALIVVALINKHERWEDAQSRLEDKIVNGRENVEKRLEEQRVYLLEYLKSEVGLVRIEHHDEGVKQMDALRKEVREDLQEDFGREVATKVERLFEDRYARQILQYTATRTDEVLGQTGEAQGLLLSRLRRLTSGLSEALKGIDEAAAAQAVGELNGAIQDWHTLMQLFSVDEDQLAKGLLRFQQLPFPEAERRLKRLQARHKDNGDLLPLINDALRKVEDLELGA